MTEARPYQQQALDTLREKFRAGRRRLLLVAPTGSGKTFMAAKIIEGALAKGNSVMFLAHRKELIDQPSTTLDALGIDHGVIKAHHWRARPHLPVQVASIQTLVRREVRPSAKVLIIDEAHRTRAAQYEQVLKDYPEALVLGLTATPARLDGRGLGHVFEELVEAAKMSELLDQGYLCPPRIFAPRGANLEGVAVKNGDFDAKAAAERFDSALIGDIVEHWRRYAADRRTICFAPNVSKSLELVRRFNAAGVRAGHVDGTMRERERDLELARFRIGEHQVLCNASLLVEGYDLPEISAVILAVATMSITKYLQMCGRGSRTAPGKVDTLILDHGGNFFIHGSPVIDRSWSLDGDETGRRATHGDDYAICNTCSTTYPPGRQCPTCGSGDATIRQVCAHEERDGELVEVDQAPKCPDCGAKDIRIRRGPGPYDLKILCHAGCGVEQYIVDKPRAHAASSMQRQQEYNRLRAVAIKHGFKRGWADHRYRETFGKWPASAWKSNEHHP